MVNNLSKYLEQAKHAAYEIGKLQLKFYEKELRVIRKTRKELVCNVDMECQQLSYELLAGESMYPVLSEEVRNASNNESDYFWVVDPLDGSHNFIAGLPIFGVSIALMNKEQSLNLTHMH